MNKNITYDSRTDHADHNICHHKKYENMVGRGPTWSSHGSKPKWWHRCENKSSKNQWSACGNSADLNICQHEKVSKHGHSWSSDGPKPQKWHQCHTIKMQFNEVAYPNCKTDHILFQNWGNTPRTPLTVRIYLEYRGVTPRTPLVVRIFEEYRRDTPRTPLVVRIF